MNKFQVGSVLKLLILVFLSGNLIYLPILYRERIVTGIFRFDYYSIWLLGLLCLIYTAIFKRVTVNLSNICCFFIIVYISLVFFLRSFFDDNSFFVIITVVCCLFIIQFLNGNLNEKEYNFIIAFLLISFSIQLFVAFKQAIYDKVEKISVSGYFLNSGFYGNYLASVIPLLFSALYRRSGFIKPVRLYFLLIFSASVYLLIFILARAAILGVAVGCLVAFFYDKKNFKRGVGVILLLVLLFAGVALFYIKQASAESRLTIYKVSLNIIKDYPLFGIGPNRFAAVYNNYQSDYFYNNNISIRTQLIADNTFEAFNSLLQLIIEYGLFGLLMLLLSLFFLFKNIKLTEQEIKNSWPFIGSFASIVSIFVSSLFSNPFHLTPIILNVLFYLAVITPKQKTLFIFEKRGLFILRMFIIIFILTVVRFSIKHYKAELIWNKASDSAKYDDFNTAKKSYQYSFSYLKYNGDFLYNYGAEASLAGEYQLSIKLLEQARVYNSSSSLYVYLADSYAYNHQYELAEKYYLHAIYIAPSYIYPKYQLVKLYKQWEKEDQMELWRNRALIFPVKVQTELGNELIKELKKM